jgi:hypothetical protein
MTDRLCSKPSTVLPKIKELLHQNKFLAIQTVLFNPQSYKRWIISPEFLILINF